MPQRRDGHAEQPATNKADPPPPVRHRPNDNRWRECTADSNRDDEQAIAPCALVLRHPSADHLIRIRQSRALADSNKETNDPQGSYNTQPLRQKSSERPGRESSE